MSPSHASALQCLEIGALCDEAELSVILMHGLGADGHDFADVASALSEAATPRRWRFVLPHAQTMPVTINMGMRMPAWYDILDLGHPRAVNWSTVSASRKQIEAVIAAESAPKIVLAGFSQGAAMALQVGLRRQADLVGVLLMSGYLLESDEYPVPVCEGPFPIGFFHGDEDDVVPIGSAKESQESLEAAGYTPTFKSYSGLGHSVSQEEVRDVFDWLVEHG